MSSGISRPRIRLEKISSAILSPCTRNPATFRSSSLGVSEESNVQSIAVAVAALEAETHEFLLSRGDLPFIDALWHEEDF